MLKLQRAGPSEGVQILEMHQLYQKNGTYLPKNWLIGRKVVTFFTCK